MTVTAVNKDTENLTMTLDAEFEASPQRVWQLWADPRQLERWWGPPTYPATFTRHELTSGGRVEYHMTGPDGDQPAGYWEIIEVEPPHRLVLKDGFADQDGSANEDMPATTLTVRIIDVGDGRTRMSIESRFADLSAMEELVAMGMEEGLTQSVAQIDALLAENAPASSP